MGRGEGIVEGGQCGLRLCNTLAFSQRWGQGRKRKGRGRRRGKRGKERKEGGREEEGRGKRKGTLGRGPVNLKRATYIPWQLLPCCS